MAFESLAQRRFAILTTYRRSGAPVPTPVWVVTDEGKAYVVSRGPGKVRRIRSNPEVEIAAGTARGRARGEPERGVAAIFAGRLPDRVRRAFRRKYGPMPALGRAVARLLGKELVLVEVTAAGTRRSSVAGLGTEPEIAQ